MTGASSAQQVLQGRNLAGVTEDQERVAHSELPLRTYVANDGAISHYSDYRRACLSADIERDDGTADCRRRGVERKPVHIVWRSGHGHCGGKALAALKYLLGTTRTGQPE